MGLRQLRLEAQEKARQIIPALFVEMFGDPAANPKGWPRVPFGDLVTIKAQLRKPDIRAEGHFACFGPEAIESRTGRLLAYGTVSECRPKSGKYLFSDNEVLYSKIRPYLAKAAIVTDKGYCSVDMYPLSRMKIVVPEFVLSLLLSQAFTDFATRESMRARMPKLNRATLFGYQAPLPPLSLQKAFASRIADIQAMITQQERMTSASERLASSLMAEAFG